MRLLPDTLFGRTAAILLATFLAAQAAALYTVWRSVVAPLAARSADDLAARMVLAAQTWVELPPATRTDYEIELYLQHGLTLGQVSSALPTPARAGYFGDLLEHALRQRTGQHIALKAGPDPAWLWAEIRFAGTQLRVGFARDRYDLDAPWEAGAVFLAGALLTLLVALLLGRRTSLRLRRLADSAREVGHGRWPARLPESGARELRDLTANFNRMAGQVQTLLENRTVLLSGLSHDLRTPITRMQLALAMLDDADADLVARLEGDLREMNRLISDVLSLARSLQAGPGRETDLAALIAAVATSSSDPARVRLPNLGHCPWVVNEGALVRVLGNLVENALRYGEDQAVEITLDCSPPAPVIRVLDRGPGIPAEAREVVFQPFHRLEDSRSRDTGGSGLGLAIVRQLADAHGWHVDLGEREGGGLVARVTLAAPVD